MILPPAHRRDEKTTDSWITPKPLIDRLGPFDFDPCACNPQPWPTAAKMIAAPDDGLLHRWEGHVWMNPPYGKALGVWLNRLALHGDGIALVFARTDTRAFHADVWPFASALLFLKGRVTFCHPNGSPAPNGHNSGGPSVLIGYGDRAAEKLTGCRDLGALVFPAR